MEFTIAQLILSLILMCYFIIIPFIYLMVWDEQDKLSYLKWYSTKGDNLNCFGYFVFVIIGSGSFLLVSLIIMIFGIYYMVISQIIKLFKILFFEDKSKKWQ